MPPDPTWVLLKDLVTAISIPRNNEWFQPAPILYSSVEDL